MYRHFLTALLTLVAVAGCDGSGPQQAAGRYPRAPENVDGIKELASPLAELTSCPASVGCTFVAATGLLTVTVADGEVAVISKHPLSGAILVNDVVTPLALAGAVKSINVVATGDVHTIIMDFSNGLFAPGISGHAGTTIDFGPGVGPNAFKWRGSSTAADSIAAGVKGGLVNLSFNNDAFPDISFAGGPSAQADSYTFSLGGGNDIFAADTATAVLRLGTGASAMVHAVVVYGGPGDDIFTGGLGNDTFYGDDGNDTFKAGASPISGTKTFSGGAGVDIADYSLRTGSLQFRLDGTAFCGDFDNGELNVINSDVETIKSGKGNDTYYPDPAGLVGHAFYGGDGIDTVDFTDVAAAVTVTMGDKTANDGVQTASPKDDIRDDVENVICAARYACIITGNTLDNTFFVPAASTAAHSFSGMTGVDTVDFTAFDSNLSVSMDSVAGTNGMLIRSDVENVKCPTLGGSPGDTTATCRVVGNSFSNHLWGGDGINTLSGLGGDDVIENVGGADVIDCGIGSDILVTASHLVTPAVGCELWDPPPYITVPTPVSAVVGHSLTIAGMGFKAPVTVTIGGQAQSAVVVSSTRLTIASIDSATPNGVQPLIVTVNGNDSNSWNVTVTGGAVAADGGVDAGAGGGGGSSNDAGSDSGVGGGGGSVTPLTPTVDSSTPTSVTIGASFDITGTNFTSDCTVSISGVDQTVTASSPTSLTITIADITTSGDLVVTVPGAPAPSSPYPVTVNVPTVASTSVFSISSIRRPYSADITLGFGLDIFGTGFTSASAPAVTINTRNQGTVTFIDSTHISIIVDPETTAGDLIVTTAAGASALGYVVVPNPPVITLPFGAAGISETFIPGDAMNIYGIGFNSGTTVTLGGVSQGPVTYSGVGYVSLTLGADLLAGTYPLVVSVNGVDSAPYPVVIDPVVDSGLVIDVAMFGVLGGFPITGTGFTSDVVLTIDGVVQPTTCISSTLLRIDSTSDLPFVVGVATYSLQVGVSPTVARAVSMTIIDCAADPTAAACQVDCVTAPNDPLCNFSNNNQ